MRAARRGAGSLLLALLAALLAPATPLHATESIEIEHFDSRIEVHPDGSFDVTERLQVRFDGSWNGILRDLSLQHTTGRGRRARLDVEVLGIEDDAGRPLRFESDAGGGSLNLRIWVPGAENATRTVILRYRVRNGLRYFGESQPEGYLDELYWQVTGTGWIFPIRRATVEVVLPEEVSIKQAAAYVGASDSSDPAPVDLLDGRRVTARTLRPLPPGQGLTIAVGWPGGVVGGRPSELALALSVFLELWPLLLPFLAFPILLRRWRRQGRDPRPEAIAVQYEPPAELSPAELGTLVDHRADMQDITATLVDLAVRGYLIIEEREEKKLLGLATSTEYFFHAAVPPAEWSELRRHEYHLMRALFSYATAGAAPAGAVRERPTFGSVELSDLAEKFYKELPSIHDAIYASLVQRTYYFRRPDEALKRHLMAGIPLLVASVLGTIFSAEFGILGLHPLAVAIGGGLTALLILGFGVVMPARTTLGARTQEKALGFREFLERVESDRFRRMITSPELFERYLPHAMAFGVEEKWARAFEGLFTTPPDWYRGGTMSDFSSTRFVDSLGSMSSRTASSMSPPSSSGSSGSGGGGSVGGGSGGGGGGGF